MLDKEVVEDRGKHKRLSEVVQRLSRVFEGEEMTRSNTPDSGCNIGEGGDIKQLKNGLTTKPVCVEKIWNKNNAYSAVNNSNEFSTNEKPEFTSSYTSSVSTNEKAGGRETRKVGGKIYPVRLPGNLGR